MPDTLISTVNHIGIRREHWDSTGDGSADYYIDDYNIADFQVPQLKILQPFTISDSTVGSNNGRCIGKVVYNGDYTDLRWSTTNWITTNSFTGSNNDEFDTSTTLANGTHTLKVKDNVTASIVAETTFIVEEHKDYGLKYELQFKDAESQLCYIRVYADGYTDAKVEICCTSTPALLEWGSGEEDKFATIKGSRAIINMLTDATTTDFNEFFTASDKEYRVDIQRAGSVIWRGFVITDEHTEAYLAPPYPVSLKASDRLGRLKTMKFESRTGVRFNNPAITIEKLLEPALLDIYYSTARIYTFCPLSPSGVSIGSSPTIAQTYVDCNAFYQEDPDAPSPDWATVITQVLKPLGLRLFYSDDIFWIQYIQDPKASITYHWEIGPDAWVTGNRDFIIDVGCKGSEDVFWINRDQVKEMMPAYRDVCVDYQFTPYTGLLPARSFTKDSFIYPTVNDTQAKHWATDDTGFFSGLKQPYSQFATLEKYAFAFESGPSGYSPGNSRYHLRAAPSPLNISSGNSGKIKIAIKYHVQHQGATTGADDEWYLVILAAGHYLDQDNTWTELTLDGGGSDTDIDDIIYPVTFSQGSSLDTKHTFELVTESIPWAEQQTPTAQVRLYHGARPASYALLVAVDEISCNFLPADADAITNREVCDENTGIKISSYTHTINHGYIDTPSTDTINRAQYFDSAGDVVSLWSQTGKTGNKDLLDVLLARINTEYDGYMPKLSGSLYGQFGFPDYLKIDGKNFIQDSMSYDLKANQRKIVAIEMSSTQAWPT